jgi:hypothetical protein
LALVDGDCLDEERLLNNIVRSTRGVLLLDDSARGNHTEGEEVQRGAGFDIKGADARDRDGATVSV